MSTEIFLYFALFVVGIIALFAVSRTLSCTKRMQHFEESIENINAQMHEIRKEIQSTVSHQKFIENHTQEGMTENINSFYRELKEIKEVIKSDRNYFEEKIIKLDNHVRDFGHLSGMNDIDEKRIIALFKEGWSVDSIAKELRIGRGEVEFTLKIADI